MSNIKSRKYYQYYTLQDLSVMENPYRFMIKSLNKKFPIEDEIKSKDDELRTNTWTELYKSAAYFYDKPNNEERSKMFKHIRSNFSGILSDTNNPNDIPSIQSRSDLMNWICHKNNEFLEKKESANRITCDSNILINTFGPDYIASKKYLGSYDY